VASTAIALAVVTAVAGCTSSVVTSTSATRLGRTTASTSSHATATTQGASVVRIGSLFPLSGDLASSGAECAAGVELAVNDVNAAGGIQSLGGAHLAVVPVDSRGKSDVAVSLAEELAKKDGVSAIIGTYQSTVALPVTEKTEDLKIPLVLSAAAADKITEQGLKLTFRLCAKADWYARDQVAFLSDPMNLGALAVTKVALLHEDGAFGTATAASQKKYLAEAGIDVVMEQTYAASTADVHEEMLKIKSSGAQAVLTATYLGDSLLMVDAYQNLKMQMPLLDAAGGTVAPEFLQKLGSSADGIFTELDYAKGQAGSAERQAELVDVEARFQSAYKYPMTANALYSYQAVWVIADALERGVSSDPVKLRDGLAATSMLPSSRMVLPQTVLDFDATGQNRFAQLFVAQFQDSKLVILWPHDYAGGTPKMPGTAS
jgi:branched-chain amino acid transport system substrate-binding protein